jgi:peroxiredoxin
LPQPQNPSADAIGPAGERAEELTLSDSTGTPRRLSEIAGAGAAVLVFYRGHW